MQTSMLREVVHELYLVTCTVHHACMYDTTCTSAYCTLTRKCTWHFQTEEQLKKRVGAKLEVAKFLQDTVSEMAKDMRTSKTGAAQASAADLYQFMKRVSTMCLWLQLAYKPEFDNPWLNVCTEACICVNCCMAKLVRSCHGLGVHAGLVTGTHS